MTRIALTLCSSLALVACHEPIKVNAPPPPREWLQCAPLPEAPELDGLTAFTMPDGTRVYLKGDTDLRDGQIARYIIALRGAHFDCANALQKVADYYAEAGR